MSTLKGLRDRKKSVQATQKITLTMKTVAGVKLRRSQEQVESGRPYAHLMRQILGDLAAKTLTLESAQPLLVGNGKEDIHLLLIATSDRGLCGPFNTSIIRHARKIIETSQRQGQTIKLFCIGHKGKTLLEKDYGSLIVEFFTDIGHPRLHFPEAQRIADSLIKMFDDGIFDKATLIYNHFKSAITQEVIAQQLIPLLTNGAIESSSSLNSIYEYEPKEETLLSQLLPHNIAVQIYNALLENAASEQGARMTAMDSASRNADDMIRQLTLTYNRTRQAQITRELIEIISGAEALV